jgi:hypothetical protein
MPVKRRRKPNPRDPRFIPGIYNYCDRWCERCEFSHRCFKFVLSDHLRGDDPKARDINNKKFWEALQRIVAGTKADLVRTSKKWGVEFEGSSIDAAAAYEKRLDRRARARGQRESNAALTYAHMVDEWFNNELRIPLQHVRNLERRVGEGTVSVPAAKGELVRLNDCVEVIRWYQTFIYVKLCRAFSSLVEEDDDRALAAAKDSSGSAKIVLIAIERSLAAWTSLREMFPGETDSILEILLHLDRLRRAVKKKFPRAKSFKRPGFDDKS